MNHCHAGGYLVEGDVAIATNPVDHDVDGLPVHGCDRLRCPRCQAMVRSVAGLSLRDSGPKVDIAALHETADLAASPLFVVRPGTRLYLCRCLRWAMTIGRRALEVPDPDPTLDPQVPWRCAGHPLAELPRRFDGEEVTADGVGELVLRSLRTGWSPAEAHAEDRQAGLWAARLHVRLAGTPWQGAVLEAALIVLDDADAKARSRALRFCFATRHPEGAVRAVAILEGDRAGWSGEKDVFTTLPADRTLEHTLWRVAAPLVAQTGRAREVAHADALAAGKGSPALYGALAAGDPEWVTAHADEIARANPGQIGALTSAVKARFPRAVPSQPVLDRLASLSRDKS